MGKKHQQKGEYDKALQYYTKAAELGGVHAHWCLGALYYYGEGVEKDMKKSMYHLEEAAIGGHPDARYNLGATEANAGNMNRALEHFMIAVEGGSHLSLKQIKQFYSKGHATKDDYAQALKAYQAYLAVIKSDGRDKAAEFNEIYKYYE